MVNRRKLGSSSIEVSELALGTWGLATGSYGPISPQTFEQCIAHALASGINTFDMAPAWGDGESECAVGRATRTRREECVYITRAGQERDPSGRFRAAFDREALTRSCEESLARLETDIIDVWLLHQPGHAYLTSTEPREVGERLKREGKIRAWGASVNTAEQARAAVTAGAEVVCLVYNLLNGDDLHDVGAELAQAGTGVLTRSVLNYGLLAGRWKEVRTFPAGDHRAQRWDLPTLRQRIRQVEMLRFLVHDEVTSMTSAALRFALANHLVSSAILGAHSTAQIDEACAAVQSTPPYISEEDMMRLPQVLAAVGV